MLGGIRNILKKLTLKNHTGKDKNRHYWKIGDIIEFSKEYAVLCTRPLGFKRNEFIVIKGFNKGRKILLDTERTPYIFKQDFNEQDMLDLARKYYLTETKLVYSAGDIVTDEDNRLLIITEILNKGKGYSAIILDQSDTEGYKYRSILLPNDFKGDIKDE